MKRFPTFAFLALAALSTACPTEEVAAAPAPVVDAGSPTVETSIEAAPTTTTAPAATIEQK